MYISCKVYFYYTFFIIFIIRKSYCFHLSNADQGAQGIMTTKHKYTYIIINLLGCISNGDPITNNCAGQCQQTVVLQKCLINITQAPVLYVYNTLHNSNHCRLYMGDKYLL